MGDRRLVPGVLLSVCMLLGCGSLYLHDPATEKVTATALEKLQEFKPAEVVAGHPEFLDEAWSHQDRGDRGRDRA